MTKNQLIQELINNYDDCKLSSSYNSFTLKVTQDEYAINPRDKYPRDNHLFCFHRRYNLGDEHNYNQEDFSSWSEFEGQLTKDYDIHTILPVYMYDHSGLILNTTGFSCPWDSGQVGYIFITNDQAKEMTDVEESLKFYVEEYSQYLNGEIYDISLYYRNEFIGGEGEIAQDIDTEVIKDILTTGCVFDDWSDEKFEKLIEVDNQIQQLF